MASADRLANRKEALCLARKKAMGTVTEWSLCRSAVEMMRSGNNSIPFNYLKKQSCTTSRLSIMWLGRIQA
eukprot:351348-Chlamydomonas_euryale.AAC.7